MNSPPNDALVQEIKQLVINTLDLEDITPDDIDAGEALFVEGLGLDSIDALELGVALQREYGIKMDAEAESTRQHFANINSLCALVMAQRTDGE